jgi:hypothetical protein
MLEWGVGSGWVLVGHPQRSRVREDGTGFFFPEEKLGKGITFEMYTKKIFSKRKEKQKQQQQKNKQRNKQKIYMFISSSGTISYLPLPVLEQISMTLQ